MQSLITRSRSILISLVLISTIGIVSAAMFRFSGSIGTPHQRGVFIKTGSGNAGSVSFDTIGTTASIDGLSLTGAFYIETIGWARFSTGTRIYAPASGNAADLWSVVGAASSNAGMIYLTGVQYNPVTKTLIGNGMNHGIGIVPLGIAANGVSAGTGITTTSISTGFQGRVKVLGNIGGKSAFDTFYGLGSQLSLSLMTDTLGRIRQNVALLSRNISIAAMNTSFAGTTPTAIGNKIFYINTGSTVRTLTYDTTNRGDFPQADRDSLIIVGGDLVIAADIIGVQKTRPNGIIVLKNNAGVGGNIIIQGAVKNIKSSIFTEGSIYSGTGMADLANDTTEKVATLPENQLYIQGSILSHNTIGGSFQQPATCPYTETTCTSERSIRYDLNYFRNYLSGTTSTRATDSTYDGYSLIIELDPRIATMPPPGF